MINKKKKIHGIGRYEAFEDGVNIQKNQIIFGFNGAGKSTLSDIFYSLSSTDRYKSLLSRKTLCKEDGTEPLPQFIEMESDNGALEYRSGEWNTTENIMVFNDHFIDEYVLINENYDANSVAIHFGKEETALASEKATIEAENIELFNSINTCISNNKSICGKLNLGKNKIQFKSAVRKFRIISELKLHPIGKKEIIEKELTNQREADDRIKKVTKWQELLNSYSLIYDLEKGKKLARLLSILKEEPRITAVEINEHVKQYMKHSDLNWLLKGKQLQTQPDVCPYCGQRITSADFKSFSKKLELYISSKQKQRADEITNTLRSIEPCFDVSMLERTFSNLQTIIEEDDNDKLLLKSTSEKIKKLLLSDVVEPEDYVSLLGKIQMKEANPYQIIELSELENSILKSIHSVYKKIDEIKSILEKERLRIENKVRHNLNYQYEEALFIASFGDNRGVFESLISNAKEFLNNDHKIGELQMKIDSLIDKKRVTQVNAFLDEMNVNYRIKIQGKSSFVHINGFEPKEFKPHEDKLLCSEGERRVLAFAYFLQMINNISGEKIIVVDDPISSLDLSRKSLVALKIVQLMNENENQVIVLSHDIAFVEKIDSLGKALHPIPTLLEIKKGSEPFSSLNLQEYLQSDESVYEDIIHEGEMSTNENDKIIAFMAMRPYSYLKSLGKQDGEVRYHEIERRSTYFAHSRYSKSNKIRYSKKLYSSPSLRKYCDLVNKLTDNTFDKKKLVLDNYRFTGFDFKKAWEIYDSISSDSIIGLRKKALVFRVVLETTLFMLIDKKRMDPEAIGKVYNKAKNAASAKTENAILAEKRQLIIKLYNLYQLSKKYHHGAEGRSTLGLSSLNPDEMKQFDKEISVIHEWLENHEYESNQNAVGFVM